MGAPLSVGRSRGSRLSPYSLTEEGGRKLRPCHAVLVATYRRSRPLASHLRGRDWQLLATSIGRLIFLLLTRKTSSHRGSSQLESFVHGSPRPSTSAVISAAPLRSINGPFLTSPPHASNAHSATRLSLVVGIARCPLFPRQIRSTRYRRRSDVESQHDVRFLRDGEDEIQRPRPAARAKLSAISRIDPQLLRRVIASTLPPPSGQLFPSPPPLPILDPSCRSVATAESDSSSAPLTIFYNGTVSVFDLAQDKAEAVIKLAERTVDCRLLERLNEELLPIPRKKSLQRFLEKRQQRLTAMAPYTADHEAASAKTTALDLSTDPTSDATPRFAIIGGAKTIVQNTN
ncbi:Divergent CCT motif [Musa troglodytarum]|uniref:Protein TIFY n=1 Tax=Musa troglodytarum TaxID=320322 RepID=A0A9E7H5N3_9LILI|nr:Divergent CCT motif [Musa troglodytarum]